MRVRASRGKVHVDLGPWQHFFFVGRYKGADLHLETAVSFFTLNMVGKMQLTSKINKNVPFRKQTVPFLKQTFGQIASEIKHILGPEAVEVM